jgi:signal transduction histidine kinase
MPDVSSSGEQNGDGAVGQSRAPRFLELVARNFSALIDRQIPPELLAATETARQARLITRFGALGSLFGLAYAAFYLAIGHEWGALIVVLSSLGVAITPQLMRWKKSLPVAGNFFSLILTLGFFSLCFVEGGLKGHAIAWLVSVPLCALLLLGTKPAARWAVVAFLAAAVVAGFDLAGVELPCTYPPQWNSVVSTAGYLGLVLFMSMLGVIFESGRARAQARMEAALADLATSNDKLVHLNNEKNEFLGIVAHDLKNPLTVIAFSAELLSSTSEPAKVTKISRAISDASSRMRDLITNLLDANAIEQGRFTSNIQCCDLNAMVRQCLANNEPSATKKRITLVTGLSENILAKADRAAVMQILENLISNALKFSPPNTSIHVQTLPEKNHVAVSVRDEGPGISAEDQARLFKKFSRLTAQPTGGESSTGLGLSIVKRLAEAMSGSTQCHSELGAGAKFTLRLPVWPYKPEAATAEPAATEKPSSVPAAAERERAKVDKLLSPVAGRDFPSRN